MCACVCVAKGDVSPEIREERKVGRVLARVRTHARRARGKWLSTPEHDVIAPELAISEGVEEEVMSVRF